jgi:serine/threonine-protein kinase RsbW
MNTPVPPSSSHCARTLLKLQVDSRADWMPPLATAMETLHWPPTWDGTQRYFVELVLEELMINACTHAQGPATDPTVCVTLWDDAGLARIEVIDLGPPFDPRQQAVPNLDVPLEQRSVGGLGLHLVRQLCDGLTHERIDGRNRVTVWRHGGST